MTNFLSTAMLSAGAACFGSIIEIEKNMAQAEIQTLIASEEMIKAQPLLMTALLNTYKAKADDQYASGMLSGFGSITAGAVQLGIVGYGAKAASEAEGAETNEMRGTSTVVPNKEATLEGNNNEEIELQEIPTKQPTNDSNVSKEAVNKDVVQNEVETEVVAKQTEEVDKRKKAASKAYKNTSTYYSNLSQIFGPMITGAATAGKTPYDTDSVKKEGTAQALNTVISGNQAAQTSNKDMVQTYKEAFTNASQILAGIVSAQRN